ncbi:MAG TPA: TetR/AcrR family transcriptional regulator, partial [Microthrixaceae bacterium]|nr:TetR/AcrR family transcriptional regulator [Microthrixaceae bacterium]
MVVERLDAEHVCTVHVYTVHVYTVDTEWYRRRIATLTRSTVVAAARARVAEHGLPSLSMRSLADDLAVTPMAIYRHVANREGLLDAIVDDALDRLGDIDEGLA